MRKFRPYGIALAVLAGVVVAYWGVFMRDAGAPPPAASGPPPAMVVEATNAVRATSVRKLKAVGTLAASRSVTIRPEVAGVVVTVGFKDGAPVEEGQRLVALDQSIWAAELKEAEANVTFAQQQYERAARLLDRGAGTERARDEARAALNTARARIDLARARLEKATVHAPFAGVVGISDVNPGEYLEPGQRVVNLEQLQPLKVRFQVSDRFMQDLFVGKPLVLRSHAYPGETFEATIDAIDPMIDPATRSVQIQAVTPNSANRLRPGQFVSVTVRVDERRDAVFVPEQSLVTRADGAIVFRVRDGAAEAVPVRSGLRIATQVEILEGIAAGDMVVTAGQQRLADGVSVTVKPPAYVPPTAPDEEIQIIN